MAKKNGAESTSKLWVKIACLVLGLLMVAGVVVALIQML